MKKYVNPSVKINIFSIEDIITQSGMVVDSSYLSGSDEKMYQVYIQNSDEKNTKVSIFTW